MPNYSLPAHRSRSFISASRVLAILLHRLGCTPTGDRGPGSEYWVTPNGARFPVADPAADQESAPVVTATGRRSLYYSYDYAASLLRRASWLVAHGRPEDKTARAHDPSLLLVDAITPPEQHQPSAAPRPLGDLADTIFV